MKTNNIDSKLGAPGSKAAPTNADQGRWVQRPSHPSRLGIWSLVIVWSLVFGAWSLPAAVPTSIIQGYVTITNTPADGNTLIVNGVTRTWKTQPVAAPSTQIAITNSIGANATNLYTYLAVYPLSRLQLAHSGTNGISLLTLANGALTITASGTWATITYVTNTVGDLTAIRVPFANIPDVAVTNRVYQATEIVRGINDYSSLALDQDATAASELVGLDNEQTITGVKTITGFWLFDSESITFTNNTLISFGGATVRFETNSSVSLLEGSSMSFGTNGSLSFVQPSYVYGVSVGTGTTNWNFNYTRDQDTVMRRKDGTNMIEFFAAGPSHYGEMLVTNLSATSGLLTGLTISNATAYNFNFAGSNSFAGTFALKRTDFTSLASGNNAAIDFSDAIYAKIVGGPTAAFSLNGILPGTFDGAHARWLIIENATGQDMTIADNSGAESVPEYRIRTLTGADVTTVGDEIIMLFYDSTIQRWKLMRGGGSGGPGGAGVSYGSQFDFTDLVHLNLAYDLATTNQIIEGNTRTTSLDVGGTSGTININAKLSSEWTARVDTGGMTLGITNWESGHNLRLTVTNLGLNALVITNVMYWWEDGTTVQPAIDQGNGYVNLFDLRRSGSDFTAGRIGLGSGSSLWKMDSSVLIPFPAVTNLLQAGNLSIGTITNTLHSTGTALIYTNLGSARFTVQNANGSSFMDNDVTGQSAHFQGGTLSATFANAAGNGLATFSTAVVPTVNNTLDLGAAGSLRWKNFALDGHVSWNGSTNTVWDLAGNGTPEGVVAAAVGSTFRRWDGGAGTAFYIKETGAATSTGWVGK